MAEGMFWIFISFFAVIGLLEIFRIIQAHVCRNETGRNILLVPIANDSDVGAECRIHTAVFERLETEEEILVVDMGMDEKNREICSCLCKQYGIGISTAEDLVETIKKIYIKQ